MRRSSVPKGQIRKALSGFYYVYFEGETYQTRGRGNFRKRKLTPMVGDYVEFESGNKEEGILKELLPRKNELVRPTVANVDLGVVVMSAIEPDFSTNLLDRFLVTLEDKAIEAVIYLTKIDLLDEQQLQEVVALKEQYEAIGYPVVLPEVMGNEQAKEVLTAYFPNHLTVFMGQSGAGKSTLLNEIAPELNLETAEISSALGRGKHTTRHVELIPLYGGLVADTPGFSSIDFLEIEAAELPELFPEFVDVQDRCRFRGCMHRKEPGCQVQKEVAEGQIQAYRYQHYLQFLEEIEDRKPRYTKKEK
ncbi:MAG: ribosome small subunit-dependent GTPase A [Carnobacterium sp.]|uniref:Small ribosomal subunit biogenesis GTPase RsgA n=1 Tax=Carnobacterium antarcticum TaxID=2126436 RepID=A0ABW4NNB6_9LACT|nr:MULTISPECIES: ribosome small subunit-dependent GTPase A [unclassified Carnobacterium]QQP71096.1 ribosome small subunit-dependent GTPase A [Carnobacterium sp. CS13]